MASSEGGRRPTVGLVGDIDMSTIDQAESLVRDVMRAGASEVVIDVGLVTFFGAAGARLISTLLQEGLEVELVGASRQIVKVLDICGFLGHPRLTV